MSHSVMLCHVVSCHVMSCHVMSHAKACSSSSVMSCHVPALLLCYLGTQVCVTLLRELLGLADAASQATKCDKIVCAVMAPHVQSCAVLRSVAHGCGRQSSKQITHVAAWALLQQSNIKSWLHVCHSHKVQHGILRHAHMLQSSIVFQHMHS